MTGVASRHVGKYIAAILVLLGLFPVIGRAFTTIPSPVLGGAMVLMFGLIAIAGVRILVSHGIRRREAVIAATSVVWVWAWRLSRKCSKTCRYCSKTQFLPAVLWRYC